MKRLYMSLCLLVISATLFAQEKITWGVHAGINIANITDKDPGQNISASSKVGFTGGIDVQLPVSSSFVIQPELNFSQLGAKSNGIADSGMAPIKTKINENYLTLPILLKYKVAGTGLGIYVGPQYGYLLSAKGTGEASGSNVSASVKMTSYYNKSDFAGIFGAEYYFPCNFGISARYQLGFTNIAKKDYIDEGESVKNHAFTFTVGYRF